MNTDVVKFHNDFKYKAKNDELLTALEFLFSHTEIELMFPWRENNNFLLHYKSFLDESEDKKYLNLKQLASKYDVELIHVKVLIKENLFMKKEKEIKNELNLDSVNLLRKTPDINSILKNAITEYNKILLKDNIGKKNKKKLIMIDKQQMNFLEKISYSPVGNTSFGIV